MFKDQTHINVNFPQKGTCGKDLMGNNCFPVQTFLLLTRKNVYTVFSFIKQRYTRKKNGWQFPLTKAGALTCERAECYCLSR